MSSFTGLVLSPSEMAAAENDAERHGVSKWRLMISAGTRVAEEAQDLAGRHGRIVVLAGPGNNGGDGFVAAEVLRRAGRDVRVVLHGDVDDLPGDARRAAAGYGGDIEILGPRSEISADLIVDALFGSGLSRPLEGLVADTVTRINAAARQVLAVDLPSGVDGRTGQVLGTAIRASLTVTFARSKPGHLLFPGRGQCGRILVADIGLPDVAVASVGAKLFENTPALWLDSLLRPTDAGHKYGRGHALVVSGPAGATGAARLSAAAALRIGAGLVTLASPKAAMAENAAQLTAIMLRHFERAADLASALEDRRFTAVAIGPGAGRGDPTRDAVAACLGSAAAALLDADALTSYGDRPETLFDQIKARQSATVLTPHDGEFAKLFPDLAADPDKVSRCRAAAARCGAVVVLKGPDTVVAAPDGTASINAHASPWLATAGSGDVLTGLVAGLLAQGMPAVEAAAAAVWLHGDAGRRFGPGLIAEDLPGLLPAALRQFF